MGACVPVGGQCRNRWSCWTASWLASALVAVVFVDLRFCATDIIARGRAARNDGAGILRWDVAMV